MLYAFQNNFSEILGQKTFCLAKRVKKNLKTTDPTYLIFLGGYPKHTFFC